MPLTVEKLQTGLASLREQHVHDLGNDLLDTERGAWPANSCTFRRVSLPQTEMTPRRLGDTLPS